MASVIPSPSLVSMDVYGIMIALPPTYVRLPRGDIVGGGWFVIASSFNRAASFSNSFALDAGILWSCIHITVIGLILFSV